MAYVHLWHTCVCGTPLLLLLLPLMLLPLMLLLLLLLALLLLGENYKTTALPLLLLPLLLCMFTWACRCNQIMDHGAAHDARMIPACGHMVSAGANTD